MVLILFIMIRVQAQNFISFHQLTSEVKRPKALGCCIILDYMVQKAAFKEGQVSQPRHKQEQLPAKSTD